MFTLAQWIARLTKGYVRHTGKKPDGLANLKIKMEAAQKVKDQSKVVDFPKDKITDWTKKASGGRAGYKHGLKVWGKSVEEQWTNLNEDQKDYIKEHFPDEVPENMASGGLARVGYVGGKLVKGAPWVINKLKEQLFDLDLGIGGSRFSKLSSTQKEGFKNELKTLIKQLERGGAIPDEMLDTMIADPQFKGMVKTRSTDKDLFELEGALLDRQAGKQADQIVDDVFGLFDADGKLNKKAVLQEVKDSEEKMLLDRFNVKDRKPNASGGIAGQLHLNRPGYGGGKLVLDTIFNLLKGAGKKGTGKYVPYSKDYIVDMKKLMQGDDPIKLFSGQTKRASNTMESFKKEAEFFGTTPEKIAKDKFKDQWFTPYRDYAEGFYDPSDLTATMRTVDLTPKEIAMAKRYVKKMNKLKSISRAKMEGLPHAPNINLTLDDNTVIIPRIKLKKLKKDKRLKTDYRIPEKIKKKLGLAEGGIAGQLHMNQGGRAKFQDGLSAYQEGMQLMGPSNLRNFPGGDREEVWDPYKGSFTSYGYDTEGATAARNEIAGRLGEKGKEYLTQYDPDYDINAMRDPFAPAVDKASTNVSGAPSSFYDPKSKTMRYENSQGVEISEREFDRVTGSDFDPFSSATFAGASTPVAEDKEIVNQLGRQNISNKGDEGILSLASPVTTFLTGGKLAPRTDAMNRNLEEIVASKISPLDIKKGNLSGTIGYSDYDKSQAAGTAMPNLDSTLKNLVSGDMSAAEFGNLTQMGRLNYDVDPMTGKINLGSNKYNFRPEVAEDTGFFAKLANKTNRAITPDLNLPGFNTPRMQAAADKGMDARMGRTYAENKQIMADPRMFQAKGGRIGYANGELAGWELVNPDQELREFTPKEIEQQRELIRDILKKRKKFFEDQIKNKDSLGVSYSKKIPEEQPPVQGPDYETNNPNEAGKEIIRRIIGSGVTGAPIGGDFSLDVPYGEGKEFDFGIGYKADPRYGGISGGYGINLDGDDTMGIGYQGDNFGGGVKKQEGGDSVYSGGYQGDNFNLEVRKEEGSEPSIIFKKKLKKKKKPIFGKAKGGRASLSNGGLANILGV